MVMVINGHISVGPGLLDFLDENLEKYGHRHQWPVKHGNQWRGFFPHC
jgi:hypothetical protein